MPTLKKCDIQKIEIAAKHIFTTSRTMVDLSCEQNIEHFNDIVALFGNISEYKNIACTNADKIYSIFYLYVATDLIEGADLKQALQVYGKENLSFLKKEAISMEKQLHYAEEIFDNIITYVKDLIKIDNINRLIIEKEMQELNFINDDSDFVEMVLQYEGKITHLNDALIGAIGYFGSFDQRRSVYLSTCSLLLEAATQALDKKIYEHVEILNAVITEKLKPGQNDDLIIKDNRLESIREGLMLYITASNISPNLRNIYKIICSYIEICRLIYCADYSCKIQVAKNAFNVSNRITNLMLSANARILDILQIRGKCCYIANKLFSLHDVNNVHLKPDANNVAIYKNAKEEGQSPKSIIRSFRFPSTNAAVSNKCLWDEVKPDNNVADITQYIDIINFFQNYVAPDRLSFMLQTKYKAQMQYMALLNNDEFNKYHKLMLANVAVRNDYLPKDPRAAIMQEYTAKLVEHLADEQCTRRGLRNCMQPY